MIITKNITKFIVKFEYLYHKLGNFVNLPNSVQARIAGGSVYGTLDLGCWQLHQSAKWQTHIYYTHIHVWVCVHVCKETKVNVFAGN